MAYYLPEPPYQHGERLKIGVLLINLGTPNAPTTSALRHYLAEFLHDRRVIELPRWLWCLILHGIILRLRPRQSAKKYAAIWNTQGSPLLTNTANQTKALRTVLHSRLPEPVMVEMGMRYGTPSITEGLTLLRAAHCDRILLVPLYPQYAASSTGSAMDAVWRLLLRTRNVPAIRTIRHYHDAPAYIATLAQSVRDYWQAHGRGEILVMSFHGLPKVYLQRGDPYHCECHKTARLLAQDLNLKAEEYQVVFQSRFGYQEWLTPYFSDIIKRLGVKHTKRIDVICPGFSSDCLETLEEIAIEGKALFKQAGGGDYHYIPALNNREDWIATLAKLVEDNLTGWLDPAWNAACSETMLREQRQRAEEKIKISTGG